MISNNTQRTFIPGSEWVYYKVYCGLNTADQILTDLVNPLAQQLMNDGIIDKWFFIRYHDPDNHLRIRFHLIDQKEIHQVILGVARILNSHVESKLIWDLQLATYQRELERYGSNTMEILESLFCEDSQVLINIIKNSPDELSRFQHIFHYIDDLINLFILDLEKKLEFLDRMQNNYKTEFNSTSSFAKKQMGKKYRSFRNTDQLPQLPISYEPIESLSKRILDFHKDQSLKLPLTDLLGSIIHMSVNRAFQSRQRLNEMVIYDFLYQKNRSDFYRQKKNKR